MYDNCNRTELIELVRKRTKRRLNGSREVLLKALEGELPEVNSIERSRKKLQLFVLDNWDAVQTNVPCIKESTAGRCTSHFCTNYTHFSCLFGAQELINAKSRDTSHEQRINVD